MSAALSVKATLYITGSFPENLNIPAWQAGACNGMLTTATQGGVCLYKRGAFLGGHRDY